MEADDTLRKAVSALTRLGGHSRESARRFLGRCTQDESRAIAACGNATDFDEAIERILDRMEANDTRRV